MRVQCRYRKQEPLRPAAPGKLEEDRVPRKYVRVDPQPSGNLTLTNLSPRVPLRLEQGPVVNPDSQLTLPPRWLFWP